MFVAPSGLRARLLAAAAMLATATACLISIQPANAAGDPPVTCTQHKADGSCVTTVTGPGQPGGGGGTTGGGGGTSGGGPQQCVTELGHVVPCYEPGLGYFMMYYGIAQYVELMKPQPPKSDPVWEGHTDGAIYQFTGVEGCGQCTNGGWAWLQNPPPGMPQPVDPAQVAATIRSTMNLPTPTFHRSPTETGRYQGQPFTYVNIPTWYWTDPADYRAVSDSVTVGGVTVTVTATPSSMDFNPGDGSGSKSCTGPGQAWASGDGNSAAPGGCSYSYPHVSGSGPVTAQLTVNWAISWTASTGANGTLAALYSQAQDSFNVLQIQVLDR